MKSRFLSFLHGILVFLRELVRSMDPDYARKAREEMRREEQDDNNPPAKP